MAFVREKEISGNTYLYLVKSIREGGKVRQKVLKYLGPVSGFNESEVKNIKEEVTQ